jgi:tetratricopeptide (TPR) repeat protein
MRRIDQARDDLSQGLNNGLDQSIFHFELYRILRADRKYAEAIEELDRAMALNEDIRLRSYNNRGLLLSYLGRFPEAVENYERELNLPTQSRPNVYIFYNIAVAKACWLGLENAKTDIEKARAEFEELLNTEKRGAALYGLGGLEAIGGNNGKAIEYLRLAVGTLKDTVDWAQHDIPWRNLYNDPQFQELVPIDLD